MELKLIQRLRWTTFLECNFILRRVIATEKDCSGTSPELQMIEPRVIPLLLMADQRLVKTKRFTRPVYVGDPLNTVRIFSDLEADEIILLDIVSSKRGREPDFGFLEKITSECFAPFTYGGGVTNLDHAKKLIEIGFERVCVNTSFLRNPGLISEISEHLGSQAVVVSIDAKLSKNRERYHVQGESKLLSKQRRPEEMAVVAEELGAGELLITSVNQEGTRQGYDTKLTRLVADSVGIPTIANGGGGDISDFLRVVSDGRASAVAASTMFLFRTKRQGVVVNYRR